MGTTLNNEAAIVGIGQTEFTKNSGVSELALAAECTRNAIEDAGLKPSDIDGITGFLLDSNDEIEVARAEGAAKAQKIISTTLSKGYLQYLWIQTLNDNPNVIYVATEANMPIYKGVASGPAH